MELLITAVAAFVIGFVWGGLITTVRQVQAFQQILKDLGVTTEQLLKLKRKIDQAEPEPTARTVIEVKLEQHNGVIYAYRKDTSQFLAQGTDRDELVANLIEKFARGEGAELIIREEDGADLVKTL